MGLYSIVLMALTAVLAVTSLVRGQRYSLFIFLAGVATFLFLAASLFLNIITGFNIFEWLPVNLYVIFFLAMMQMVAGGIGLSTMGARWLLKRSAPASPA